MSTITIGNAIANAYVHTGSTDGVLDIVVANGLINCASNSGAVRLPSGTTSQRPIGVNGMMRYNVTTNAVEGYANNTWVAFL